MGQQRGNPYLKIRLEPQVLARLRERIPPPELGRAGGVSGWLRGLIYRELNLGEPPRYAAEVSPRKRRKGVPECPLQAALEDAVRSLMPSSTPPAAGRSTIQLDTFDWVDAPRTL